ncbi:ATP-dependent RNA helicase DBP4, putative [Plasmodium malariae]|uniref:ATP-dependent RNA helicase n=1 Tax=Plasmodium malariae TaxID=5858 RepID=A0A1D3TCY4_PLAMA|nr:ATP-dependent RNA helicase DBP4, putative [Plasmodium malariae]SCP02753.1 ATP-dependent RNA helicase DBP4, putative [Plasmodium malariae]
MTGCKARLIIKKKNYNNKCNNNKCSNNKCSNKKCSNKKCSNKKCSNNKYSNNKYSNKIKKKSKGKNEHGDNIDERSLLQKEIDEKLGIVVEENKKKQYEEQWKSNINKNDSNSISEKPNINVEDSKNDKKKDKSRKYKNNLTIIDKHVLTSHEFKTLPISKRTLKALNENNFVHMTNIQSVSIPIVLLNKHIYAQAQTGTGKTLCFCIPLVEKMYRNSIDSYNKILGGLIITPTRELVFQIFEVLNMLNKYHKLNICCAIGGKDEEREKCIFSYANIIVCTTGRLLFHLENNYYCNLDYLSTLVIDEIDKLIDKSFYDNLKNILLYKPKENCQICLFSATICKFLNIILKTFCVKDYEYVSINDNDKYIENNNVQQIFIECSIYNKINYLYTFLFSKKNKKIIVFFSTCKQVRFMYEAFKKIKVGVMKFLQLHGKLKQTSRLNTYHFFSKKQNFVCLFTTDIACRGLDFASVDWVIHFDFPETVETFIHRSGRTGRFTNVGNSLIFLTSEIDDKKIFLHVLKENNIEIKEKFIKKQKLFDISNKIHSLNAAFVEIKYLAKKALVIYLRHLYIVMKFKDIKKIDLNQLAYAYGLIEFSADMMEELNISSNNKVAVNRKRTRFEKYLEILNSKKLKKRSERKEGKTEERAEEEVREEEVSNGGNTHKCVLNSKRSSYNQNEKDSIIFSSEKKNKILNDYKHNDISDNEILVDRHIEELDDDFFKPKKVEIEDNSLILLPTRKRKKRVKVAKTLSNSILYDEDGNEINDDKTKLKILLDELNEDKKDGNQDEEDEHIDIFNEKTYIESLKEKVEKDNEQTKFSKLRKKEKVIQLKMSDSYSSDEHSDLAKNPLYDENEESCSSCDNNNTYKNLEQKADDSFIKDKRNRKLHNNKSETKMSEENINEDISCLENKVLAFL